MSNAILLLISLSFCTFGFGQAPKKNTYYAGFKSIQFIDSTRLYKPDTPESDELHFRPVELDIWYPSHEQGAEPIRFKELFGLFESRANLYQDEEDYSGLTEELLQYFAAGLDLDPERGLELLEYPTESYVNVERIKGQRPLILYLAGQNGMGFENYRLLERLAQEGYLVVSIWSTGRYPGDMTNDKLDMLQQVEDAEFALYALKSKLNMEADLNTIGLLACSWGGMSAAVLLDRNPAIKAFVSLDGTETHYFGESEADDELLLDIYQSDLLHPERLNSAYLYMESGNKLDGFSPIREYHYFKQLSTQKYYLRFINGTHEDFLVIPSLMQASERSRKIYQTLTESTLSFFNTFLLEQKGFNPLYQQLLDREIISGQAFDIYAKHPGGLNLEGTIKDEASGDALPYVNVGILNRDRGTVSDTEGHFILQLDETYLEDSLRISILGYKAGVYSIRDLLDRRMELNINLQEEATDLQEVVVTAKELKSKIIGNKTKSKFLSTGFFYDQLGSEMGVKINIGKKPTYPETFNFNIAHNRLSAKSWFRLNFYTLSQGQFIGNILSEQIIIPVEAQQTGPVSIDLKPYFITLTEDVVVTLEWVDTEEPLKKGEGIYFSLGFINGGSYVRYSSQGEMKKKKGFGVGFNMKVSY